MSYRQAIHDLLVETAVAGSNTEALYTRERPSRLVEGDPVTAVYAEANEVRSAFGIDERYGREFRQERLAWAWLLKVRFDTEVILEEFEHALLRSPLVVLRDPGNGIDQQVRLLLEESVIEHPPRGGASNGTEVTYRFTAELCPQ
jgi:hypothetical protein